jgi:hypothetical protein
VRTKNGSRARDRQIGEAGSTLTAIWSLRAESCGFWMVVSPLMALSFKAVAPILCLQVADLLADAAALSEALAALPLEADSLLEASLLAMPDALALGSDALAAASLSLSALRDDLRLSPSRSSSCESAQHPSCQPRDGEVKLMLANMHS